MLGVFSVLVVILGVSFCALDVFYSGVVYLLHFMFGIYINLFSSPKAGFYLSKLNYEKGSVLLRSLC